MAPSLIILSIYINQVRIWKIVMLQKSLSKLVIKSPQIQYPLIMSKDMITSAIINNKWTDKNLMRAKVSLNINHVKQ